ncbi:MAG: hypothetical protein ACK5B8_04450 [Bacteroidota bacterium]|jgi:hypothetical protein
MKNYLILFFLLFITPNSEAQTTWENISNPVYDYLNRMASKGLISIDDVILPISKQTILIKLKEISNKQLTKIERSELEFYVQDYATIDTTNKETINLIKRDEHNRFRLVAYKNKIFHFYFDPIIGAQRHYGNLVNYTTLSKGMNLWGFSGKWGYQMYFRDNGLKGSGLDSINFENPSTINLNLFRPNSTVTSTAETRAHVSYTWKNGNISFGKDFITWGYGQTGKIVLSDRTPSFPYLRIDYKPVKGIHFNYFNAWLNSNIIDSSQSYGTGTTNILGDIRVQFIPKFLVSHSLHLSLIKGLTLSLGESVVYSDKLDPGFLIPFLLYKPYDNNRSNYNINAGSNGQIFMQLSTRNILPKTHIYFTTFIDEIRISKLFNKNYSRNQLGYQTAFTINDLFLKYLGLSIEYTKVRPFVYANLLPAQNYSNYNFPLGDWMNNNFDRTSFIAKYTPLPRLKFDFRYNYTRKGENGTLWQQYFQEPQPPFLFGAIKKRKDLIMSINYEWKNNFYIFFKYQNIIQNINQHHTTTRVTNIGFSYGL